MPSWVRDAVLADTVEASYAGFQSRISGHIERSRAAHPRARESRGIYQGNP